MPEPTNPPTLTEIEERHAQTSDELDVLDRYTREEVEERLIAAQDDRAHLLAEVRRLEREKEESDRRYNDLLDRGLEIAAKLDSADETHRDLRAQLEAAERHTHDLIEAGRVILDVFQARSEPCEAAYVEHMALEKLHGALASAPPPRTWTRERPTEAGDYWVRDDDNNSRNGDPIVDFAKFDGAWFWLLDGCFYDPCQFDLFCKIPSPPPLPGPEGGA